MNTYFYKFKKGFFAATDFLASSAMNACNIGFKSGGNDKNYLQSYKIEESYDNPTVFKCVNLISNTIANVDWYVEKDFEITNTNITDRILKEANNALNSPIKFKGITPAVFKYQIARLFSLTSCVPIAVTRRKNRLFDCAIVLDKHDIEYVQNDNGIAQYIVKNGFNGISETVFDTEETYFNSNTPINNYIFKIMVPSFKRGFNGGDSVLFSIYDDIKISKILRQRFLDVIEKGGLTKHIIAIDGNLSLSKYESLKKEIAGSNDLIYAPGVDLKITALPSELNTLKDAVLDDSRDKRIASAFGVPFSLVGIGDYKARYKDNMNDIIISFFQDVITPRYLKPIEESLSLHLLPKGLKLKFDVDSIPKLQAARALGLRNLNDVNSLSINEKREMYDFPPIAKGDKISDIR